MITTLSDIEVINHFLSYFETKLETIDSNPSIRYYLGYQIEDKIVGMISYTILYERAEIEYIYVEKDSRGQRIATKLLNAMLEHLKKNECSSVSLEVRQSNRQAISFYEKNGFMKKMNRKNYYKNEDGILMVREMIK